MKRYLTAENLKVSQMSKKIKTGFAFMIQTKRKHNGTTGTAMQWSANGNGIFNGMMNSLQSLFFSPLFFPGIKISVMHRKNKINPINCNYTAEKKLLYFMRFHSIPAGYIQQIKEI